MLMAICATILHNTTYLGKMTIINLISGLGLGIPVKFANDQPKLHTVHMSVVRMEIIKHMTN